MIAIIYVIKKNQHCDILLKVTLNQPEHYDSIIRIYFYFEFIVILGPYCQNRT